MTRNRMPLRHTRVTARLLLPLFALAGGLTGCSDPLAVSDPTAILESDVNSAQGAELLRSAVLRGLYQGVGQAVYASGLLADEFRNQPASFWVQQGLLGMDDLLDRRATAEYFQKSNGPDAYTQLQKLWLSNTPVAIAKLKAYAVPGAREAHVGEVFAVRGYTALLLAEQFCPGFPLHDVVNYKIVTGPPLSTEEALGKALAAFDSAVSWAADSTRVLNFARVGRARTLLNLGRLAEAASAVAEVPTDYVASAEYNSAASPSQPNILAINSSGWANEDFFGGWHSVANREGETGLDFVSAKDPRAKADSVGMARNGTTRLYGIAKYPNQGSPIVMANGVEARLIEAEAKLRENPNNPQWLAILNALRAAYPDTALSNHPLADPGTDAARVDLLFRERAFWLFATGHRLGDLRRLIQQYHRPSASVFPAGGYWQGGVYDTGTSIPFSKEETTNSPGVTGCTGV